MYAVEASDLHKRFGAFEALRGVSFSVPQGTLVGLIGADGAGKTTLMRILATLIAADKGRAMVLGKNTATDMAVIRSAIGYMPQRFSLYQDLTVRENLLFFADVFGIAGAERDQRMTTLLAFSRLDRFQGRRAGHLSGGMKQKLALSCALIHTPRLLILDEPTTGVDPVSRKEFWEILFDLKRQGITLFVSTPYMDEATRCDSLLLLHRGAVVRSGTPQSFVANYPYALYTVTGQEDRVTVPLKTLLPEGFAHVYPSAGALHVAVKDRALRPETVLAHVKKIAPAALSIAPIAPTIEDVLFALLGAEETTI